VVPGHAPEEGVDSPGVVAVAVAGAADSVIAVVAGADGTVAVVVVRLAFAAAAAAVDAADVVAGDAAAEAGFALDDVVEEGTCVP
jgi:hypothetical protein